jgi:predicted PurR-regulated permease PerM
MENTPRNNSNGAHGKDYMDAPSPTQQKKSQNGRSSWILIGAIFGVIILLAFIAGAVYYLVQPSTPTERIRDIFIIFMALVSVLVGIALVILTIQIASLINLLQNEIKPILKSTNETANTLKGTTEFLSDHLVGPVIKMNEYLAGLRTLLMFRRK